MEVVIFSGPPALSPFRRAALIEQCRHTVPGLIDLDADYVFAASLRQQADALTQERLVRVLDVAVPTPDSSAGAQTVGESNRRLTFWPRPGTISPWSSKATDILHNCGLDVVRRVERGIVFRLGCEPGTDDLTQILPLLHDRMTEALIDDPAVLFAEADPRPMERIPLMSQGRGALAAANEQMGLAMSPAEQTYFCDAFEKLGRDPTDVELVMFANVNSEHCRHKIFNAGWHIDDDELELSLLDMIRNTHARHPECTVSAYADNAGVIEGFEADVFRPDISDFAYGYARRLTHIVCKVETHNHPTAISPYPGASTGVGGEIRDEGSTGRGSHSQAGLSAFYTSHLRIPGYQQPWEIEYAEFPGRLATPLEIMTQGPLGGAAFGNEFGRPNLLGVFRTYEERVDERIRGYHKPIMVAGGCGLIDDEQVEKQKPEPGDRLIQIGGPAMLIGLGGGYASSMDTGSNTEDLDFASVQRDNPEMQRRCQELISRCFGQGTDNPIRSIHDVGAGGLSNACPELVEESGARFDLRAIHNDDPGMNPMELWSNEAQERYVLFISRDRLEAFDVMAARERCPYAVIGEVTGDHLISLHDSLLGDRPIDDLPLEVILGKPPRLQRDVRRGPAVERPLYLSQIDLVETAERVLRYPAVADKTFLITIADRTVTGLIARDQMVGPHQVPVSDVAVTTNSFRGYSGSAMSMGERSPLALIDAPASGRMAIAEAITNIAAADIGPIGKVKLSANWMCACGEDAEDAALYDTVKAVGMEFCPELGVSIPVGKDSLSMRTRWQDSRGLDQEVVAPLSLVISAFGPVSDVRRTVTPQLDANPDTVLLLVDLGRGANRLGASCLAQVYNQVGDEAPDITPGDVAALFAAVQELIQTGKLIAYHDRSDGGLLVTLAEMAFASACGLHIDLADTGTGDAAVQLDIAATLFSEEIGAVLQIHRHDEPDVRAMFDQHGLGAFTHAIGHPTADDRLLIEWGEGAAVFDQPVSGLRRHWSELTYRMQAQRDDPDCARQEYESKLNFMQPGLSAALGGSVAFNVIEDTASGSGRRPRVAVLREQGINGQVEMAAAFDAGGFQALDVTMTDLIAGRTRLDDYDGLVACGGFSYGDVLGAGAGWARSVLFNDELRRQFSDFFARPDSFSLGVCNGCQMLSLLRELIPGAEDWPRFVRNQSEQFEARLVGVEIVESQSVLLRGMAGFRLPIAVAHGEGRATFGDDADIERLRQRQQVSMRYVDGEGKVTMRYPENPNGSPNGITALTTTDGRVTIMMPHPERVFRNLQLSWRPVDWTGEYSPWLQLFRNARDFAG